MRIYGNRQLRTLQGQTTRPTSARVREALFNIWRDRITNARWLDLCAGNGVMGAEALCRGARCVIAIELNGKACQIIKQNWQQVVNQDQDFRVIKGDANFKLKTLPPQQFDLIYLDPPYASQLYLSILEQISKFNLLAPDGAIAVEHNPKYWQAASLEDLTLDQQKTYSNTTLSFYSHS